MTPKNSSVTMGGSMTVRRIMQLVLIALAPGCAVHLYLTGWGGLINLILATSAALVFEAVALRLRGQPITDNLADYSALLTGLLIGLCLPPLIPLWIPVLASAFAIILAKHIYGGLGHNIFNPAMVGYAAVLVSFPRELSLWPSLPEAFSLSLPDTVTVLFSGGLGTTANWDSMTGATTLDALRQSVEPTQLGPERWANLAFLIGGLWMLRLKIVNWHIPLAMLLTIVFCSIIHQQFSPAALPVTVQLFAGATMLGAFFIATDPVSAATGNTGRLLYGAGIGFLVWLIRSFGGYPDALAFAVLLMNCTVPILDYLEPWTGRRKP